MELNCKHCGAGIPAEHVNIEALMAKCAACNSVFSFALEGQAKKHRGEVGMPSGITVQTTGHELIISRRWFSAASIFLIVFTLFWDGFMVVWFGIAITQKQWAMAAFGSIHALVGLGLLYGTLASCLNRTVIRVNRNRLQVVHGPIRVPGNVQLKADLVAQLWCKMRVTHGKQGANYSYELHANSTHGKTKKLLGGLREPEQALYVEQEIERFLGIEDEAVDGEYRS